MTDPLAEGLAKLGLSPDVMPLLNKYIEEIELFNPAYGLVKVKDRQELIVKHILDSLAPLGEIKELAGLQNGVEKPAIADVGTGAGLPGIPLAICMPGAEFTLVERMGRRVGFLRNTLALLGLSNICVEETEMEKIAVKQEGNFDIIVFRAFRPLESDIVKNLLRLLKPNGSLAAYKGRREVLEEEMDKLLESPNFSALSWELFPLEVPFLEEERHLLVIRQKR